MWEGVAVAEARGHTVTWGVSSRCPLCLGVFSCKAVAELTGGSHGACTASWIACVHLHGPRVFLPYSCPHLGPSALGWRLTPQATHLATWLLELVCTAGCEKVCVLAGAQVEIQGHKWSRQQH